MRKIKSKKLSKLAMIIIAGIVIISILSIISIYWMYYRSPNGHYAEIYQHGELIKTVDLTAQTEYQFKVEGDNGAYNVIEVRNGSIGIVEASCPDGTCVHMGFINSSGIPIVCLPNEVVIKVVDKDSEIDAVDMMVY